MADIMHGIIQAERFGNGLFKRADESIPFLQCGQQDYHIQALADIDMKMKITGPSYRTSGIGSLEVFSFLYHPFKCFSLGLIQSALYKVKMVQIVL